MSILQGSDEDIPVSLPCEREGRAVESGPGGFCKTCNEHLCQLCYNSHLLPKPLANHVLLDKSMMPRVAPPPDDTNTKHSTEHRLEYYCTNHDKLECRKCVDIHNVKKKQTVKIQAAFRSSEVTQTYQSSSNGTEISSKGRQNTPQDMIAIMDERINFTTWSDDALSDSCPCAITGSVITSDNMLAVADWKNKSVTIVDLNQKKVINHLSLDYQPLDITHVDEHTLAVTCPDGGYIQLVRVSRSGILTLDRQIQVGGHCYGVSYIDTGGGKLVVSFVDPYKVKVMEMSGTVVKDLSFDEAGQPRFNEPLHITISNDGSTLIVSNAGNSTVTGLTLDGVEKFVYQDKELVNPGGVAVGDGGGIYVCGYNSHNIHVISSEGSKIKVLLEEKDGVRNPESITYFDNTLFVGSDGLNHVDVYRIQYP